MKVSNRLWLAGAMLAFGALACTSSNFSSVQATANSAEATVLAAASAASKANLSQADIQGTVVAIQVQQTVMALNQTPVPQPVLPTIELTTSTPQAPAPEQGTVTGKVCFPAGGIPPLILYALNTVSGQSVSVPNPENNSAYSMSVPSGVWVFFAYLDPSTGGGDALVGAYSAMVPCGLTAQCNDHGLIPITVTAGGTFPNVDICDWYAPAGSFPARP